MELDILKAEIYQYERAEKLRISQVKYAFIKIIFVGDMNLNPV